MKVIDLSHTIHIQMPVFPGTEPPLLDKANTLQKDGFAEKKITMYSHTGTHMDAPAHMLDRGPTLDHYNIGYFLGNAVLIDCTSLDSDQISLSYIKQFSDRIKAVNYLILKTGWDQYWSEEQYFYRFPTLSVEAAAWLTKFDDLRGVGVDTISVDPIDSKEFPIHHTLFRKDLIIVENLTNLDTLSMDFMFICTPLRIKEADGSPVRAIGIEHV